MKVSNEHGAHVPAEISAAIRAGLERVGADSADVIFTADFDHTVRKLTGHPTYSGDRNSGTVIAKTLPDPPSTIVFNERGIARHSLAMQEIERFAAHEGCHALMYNRGEGISWHHDLASNQGQFDLLAAAAEFIEEYRCELTTVRDCGYPPQRSVGPADLGRNLHNLNVSFVEAVADSNGDDPQDLLDGVRSAVAIPLIKTLAITSAAAVNVHGDLAKLELDAGAADWDDYVCPTWSRRFAFLSALSPATDAWGANDYRAALRAGADIERELMLDVGFEYVFGGGSDWGFRGCLADGRLASRLERAAR